MFSARDGLLQSLVVPASAFHEIGFPLVSNTTRPPPKGRLRTRDIRRLNLTPPRWAQARRQICGLQIPFCRALRGVTSKQDRWCSNREWRHTKNAQSMSHPNATCMSSRQQALAS
ncbi:hypothetical protein FIBSPDRAFT_230101 [Athelia psychrophila]|uniref:Uncharacterized protein n=1 Tax=Athelia psychrophila TaxID=1759441 RepID=A0A165YPS0_9AGAM|nr:hypothetical protein FIBSPDRAFT_230101 [Fibularhizoctonia sp. CBS 109695]